MMIRGIIFILVLFFLAGCGMSGSKTEDDSKDISTGDSVANTDLNVTDNSHLIAVVENEEISDEEKETILPQTFSIEFPLILKKEFRENNATLKDEVNATFIEIHESNETVDSNIIDINSTFENNNTIDSNSSFENNQTVEYCDEVDDNKTIEDREENESDTTEENVAFNDLKDKIEKIERIVKISQVNLTVLEESMPQILDNCGGIDFNTTCPFEENELSVVMDNETVVKILSIIEDNNITFPDINDSGVSLGEVLYKKYSDDTLYQYGLSHEMSSEKNRYDLNISKKEQYTFKWSDSSEDIFTEYSYEDNKTESNVSIHYLLGEDGRELMHVSFIENSSLLRKKGIINLILVKKGDENGSYTITSDSIEEFKDGNDTNISAFSSNGDISDDSSLLLFTGSMSSENNSTEIETTTTLQDNRVICDMNISEDVDIELYELNITGVDLKDGEYLLFEPDIVIGQLSSLEIYEYTIGSFTVDGDRVQGGLRGDNYIEILDQLIIIRLTELEDSTEIFKIISDEHRPNLEIIKE